MKLITIRPYEMKSLTRWGWHTFRGESKPGAKDYAGPVIGFRFLGVGLLFR